MVPSNGSIKHFERIFVAVDFKTIGSCFSGCFFMKPGSNHVLVSWIIESRKYTACILNEAVQACKNLGRSPECIDLLGKFMKWTSNGRPEMVLSNCIRRMFNGICCYRFQAGKPNTPDCLISLCDRFNFFVHLGRLTLLAHRFQTTFHTIVQNSKYSRRSPEHLNRKIHQMDLRRR